MKKLLKSWLPIIAMLSVLTAPLCAPAVGYAITTGPVCEGANLQIGEDNCSQHGDPQQSVNDLIGTVINVFSIVVGVAAVIMIIIGGLRYVTSGGDSTSVSGAKNAILYAIVGLVIVAMSQLIVKFVLTKSLPTCTPTQTTNCTKPKT